MKTYKNFKTIFGTISIYTYRIDNLDTVAGKHLKYKQLKIMARKDRKAFM